VVADELVWAVTDGPEGTHAVLLPEDGAEARRLAVHHRGRFWCAREAGGCGERLVLLADDGRPAFRHRGEAPCALAGHGPRAGRGYEHLRFQPGLTAWLAGQGHRPRVEKVIRRDGGIDLHVVVADVGAALELQLAPLSDVAWRERDDAVRGDVPRVTWLYGPAAEAGAATEAAVRGVSLSLRRHGPGLVVGVRDDDDRIRWVRLAACRLTRDGVEAPGIVEARALHARRTAEREEAARRVARQAARRARTAGRGLPAAAPPWMSAPEPLPFPG
jgi:hypothetical protein